MVGQESTVFRNTFYVGEVVAVKNFPQGGLWAVSAAEELTYLTF